MLPVVSVVIATFNRGDLLKRAIDSVLCQTYPAVEIVVVDDGSTDDTPTILARYGERISVVRQENRERAAARNTGIAVATGDLIAFLDSDDEWLPAHLERVQEAFAASDGTGLVYASAEFYDDNAGRSFFVGPTKALEGDPVVAAAISNPFAFSATAVRRQVLERVGCFDEDRALSGAEDWELWLRCLVVTQAVFVPHVGARLHFHGDNTVGDPVRMEQAFRVAAAKWRQNPEVARRVSGHQRAVSAGLATMVGRAYLAAGDRRGARRRLLREMLRHPELLVAPTVVKTLGRAVVPGTR